MTGGLRINVLEQEKGGGTSSPVEISKKKDEAG